MLYHLQVMLFACGVAWTEVLAELARREGRSGLAEKASRRDPERPLKSALRTVLPSPIEACGTRSSAG